MFDAIGNSEEMSCYNIGIDSMIECVQNVEHIL